MRLTFGALSLGSRCPQASARVLVDGRIYLQPQGAIFLWSAADFGPLICSSTFGFSIRPFVQAAAWIPRNRLSRGGASSAAEHVPGSGGDDSD
jgi:hypothetical protein